MWKFFTLLVAVCVIFESAYVGSALKISVIGAGASGLVSTKLAIDKAHEVTTYEQSKALGGTWWYTDEVGKNKYGIPVHTAAYQGLRAQTPMQSVEFPDHKYSDQVNAFPFHDDIFQYLEGYAKKFDLKKKIKFLHQVTNVKPLPKDKWNVTVVDLANNKTSFDTFDAVFVCNGQNFKPYIAKIDGVDKFKGKVIHSHDYRKAADFKGKRVMVFGGGPSGLGIASLLSETAKAIIWVAHPVKSYSKENDKIRKVTYEKEISCLTETGVDFPDGTCEDLDAVIIATGYDFAYPFLGTDCGLTWKDNHVQPLFKQIFNIKYPTMIFIGLPSQIPSFPTYHFQAECALAVLSGKKTLPTKEKMEADRTATLKTHLAADRHKRHMHQLAYAEYENYYEGLSKLTGVTQPQRVIFNIFFDTSVQRKKYPVTYKNSRYAIAGESFEKTKNEIVNKKGK